MSLEGLKAILDKEEVVVTYQALDLIERPKQVDEAYQAHLRTYVPIHSGAEADALSVEAFTRRFVQAVQNGRVPRGYLTADFGFGKTSTGLYIWGQAAKEHLLSIPPFQLNSLMDFIHATYGWIQYTLGFTKPSLQENATKVYDFYRARSIAAVAAQYDIPEETATRLAQDRPQVLELAPGDVSRYFREMTELAQEAGFAGLVVIADEIQQYLEPEIKAGKSDPVGPLFNIIQNLGGQTGLKCGLLLIIPTKELGVINDQRGDLIDRMRNMALDLKTIYDRGFPIRLWSHLAKTFDFEDHASSVVRAETLLSLGQIAARDDLANGPRTVVNALRSAIRRYLDPNITYRQPYTPIDLINDFLSGENVFDGTKRIQEIVSRALEHSFVRTDQSRGDAVRLAGAFPTDGATAEIQTALGLEQAFRDLRAGIYGEVVIEVGDHANPGTTLRGLEAVEEPADWLMLALRDFNRNYHENAALVKTRALNGIKSLLKMQIFKNDWKVEADLESGIASSAGMILEGAFASFRREFPARRIQVSIVFDDEHTQYPPGDFDVWLEFRLRRYLDLDAATRKDRVSSPVLDEVNNRVDFELNLMRRLPEAMNRAMENFLAKVVASEQLTPLFLLALHGYFEILIQQGNVPKPEQPLLTMQFMPAILDSVVKILLDRSFGSRYDASGARLVEKLMLSTLRARYGTDYHTFMVIGTWRNSLRDYVNILNRLPSALHRQGFIPLEGTKEQIASQFNLSNTTLDNFLNAFPDLIELIEDFKRSKPGKIRMRFHPLEEKIKAWITVSSDSSLIQGKSAHCLSEEKIYRLATPMGYRQEEIEYAIQLLIDRKWAVRDQQGNLCEIPPIAINPEEVAQAVIRLAEKVRFARNAFPDAVDLLQFEEDSNRLNDALAKTKPPARVIDPRVWQALLTRAQRSLTAVDVIIQRQKAGLINQVNILIDQCANLLLPDVSLLIEPDSAAILAEKLGKLYADLVQKAEHLKERAVKLRKTLGTVNQHLLTGQDSEKTLIKFISQARQTQIDLTELATQSQLLDAQFRNYIAWTQISRLHADLLSQIDQIPSNSISIRHQFDTVERELRELIDQGWEIALQQGPVFERRLKALIEQTRQISARAAQQFEFLQHRYLDALKKIDCPPNQLPELLVYSPLDPERVYAQFYLNIQKAVIVILDVIEDEIQQYCSQLRQKMVMDDTPSSVKETILILEDELNNLSSQLPYSLANQLENIQNENMFFGLVKKALVIHDSLSPYSIQLVDLDDQAELTDSEARLIQHLSKFDPVNLVDLWAKIEPSDSDVTWNAIRGLWEKNIVQVVIRRMTNKKDIR